MSPRPTLSHTHPFTSSHTSARHTLVNIQHGPMSTCGVQSWQSTIWQKTLSGAGTWVMGLVGAPVGVKLGGPHPVV